MTHFYMKERIYRLESALALAVAERDIMRDALQRIANVPGCGCDFPCRCGGEEWTKNELEARMDIAADALDRASK